MIRGMARGPDKSSEANQQEIWKAVIFNGWTLFHAYKKWFMYSGGRGSANVLQSSLAIGTEPVIEW